MGCDGTFYVPQLHLNRFNPRTRVGCDSYCAWAAWLAEFQSTHPCGVRRYFAFHDYDSRFVSIHAPVWGATTKAGDYNRQVKVSIHAPVWGATCVLIVCLCIGCFNPRTRVGCDQSSGAWVAHMVVSIHAPVWGATYAKSRGRYGVYVSIHAPVWGATF